MDTSLTISGALFMGVSWFIITALLIYSFYKILREDKEKITGVPEIEKEIDETIES
jgi:hypothetical protein